MTTSLTSYLDDEHPSVVVQMSCQNGHSEYDSLAAHLLQNGAIATVAATKNTHFSCGAITAYDTATSDAGIGYRFVKHLFDDYPCSLGKGLYEAKNDLGLPGKATRFKNLLVFNLYGDPAMEWKVPMLRPIVNLGDRLRDFDEIVVEELDDYIADWIWE